MAIFLTTTPFLRIALGHGAAKVRTDMRRRRPRTLLPQIKQYRRQLSFEITGRYTWQRPVLFPKYASFVILMEGSVVELLCCGIRTNGTGSFV